MNKKKKKKVKTNKKALCIAFMIGIVLLLFTMIMIVLGRDTTSLEILATAGVGILPIMYGIYNRSNTQINLKHMEQNYIENYDEKEGLY